MNLSELIVWHKGTQSYEALSKDCGGSPRAARLQQLATQPQKNFPDPPTIRALARGLRVSEVSVVLAAAESLGLGTERLSSRVLDLLPAGMDHWGDEDLQVVASVAHRLHALHEKLSDVDERLIHALRAAEGLPPLPENVTWVPFQESGVLLTAEEALERGLISQEEAEHVHQENLAARGEQDGPPRNQSTKP